MPATMMEMNGVSNDDNDNPNTNDNDDDDPSSTSSSSPSSSSSSLPTPPAFSSSNGQKQQLPQPQRRPQPQSQQSQQSQQLKRLAHNLILKQMMSLNEPAATATTTAASSTTTTTTTNAATATATATATRPFGLLRPTATVVRQRNGQIKIEKSTLLSAEEQQRRTNISREAGMLRKAGATGGVAAGGGSIAQKELVFQNQRLQSMYTYPLTSGILYEWSNNNNSNSNNAPCSNTSSSINTNNTTTNEICGGGGGWWWLPVNSINGHSNDIQKADGNIKDTTANHHHHHHDQQQQQQLTVLSFNVWFSEFEWKRRQDALIESLFTTTTTTSTATDSDRNDNNINSNVVDVVCLQEITSRFLSRLLENPKIQQTYRIVISIDNENNSKNNNTHANNSADTSQICSCWYGVAMLIKKNISIHCQDGSSTSPSSTLSSFVFGPAAIRIVPLHTKMGRTALLLTLGSSSNSSNTNDTNSSVDTNDMKVNDDHDDVRGVPNQNNSTIVPSLIIGTVHLESLNSRPIRSIQLQQIQTALLSSSSSSPSPSSSSVLLVGDMNITSTGPWADPEEEDQLIKILSSSSSSSSSSQPPLLLPLSSSAAAASLTSPVGAIPVVPRGHNQNSDNNKMTNFVDVWTTLHCDDNFKNNNNSDGMTFCTNRNPMLAHHTRFADTSRYDKMLFQQQQHSHQEKQEQQQSSSRHWKPTSIQVVGDQPIPSMSHDQYPIFISDHFGLLTTLQLFQ